MKPKYRKDSTELKVLRYMMSKAKSLNEKENKKAMKYLIRHGLDTDAKNIPELVEALLESDLLNDEQRKLIEAIKMNWPYYIHTEKTISREALGYTNVTQAKKALNNLLEAELINRFEYGNRRLYCIRANVHNNFLFKGINPTDSDWEEAIAIARKHPEDKYYRDILTSD